MAGKERKPSDPRFKNFAYDPRYRLPSKKDKHTKLDKRFAALLEDEEFATKGSGGQRVDRYGRPAKLASGKHTKSSKNRLGQLYELDAASSSGSSGEDQADEDEDDSRITAQRSRSRIDEKRKAAPKSDPARGAGFDESSSSSESESESELEAAQESDDDVLGEEELRLGAERERKEVEGGEVTHRIAIVNMDFDQLRAADVMAVASSFVPVGGRILRVTIYPSEFGKERMERERMQGPAPEIFGGNKAEIKEDEESEGIEGSGDEQDDDKLKAKLLKEQTQNNEAAASEVDSKAIRRYQMQRLRYFYAVMECSDKNTAHAIYEAIDEREYLSSANVFNLRFVPDEVSFDDDQPWEVCEAVPPGYRPNEFVTDALTRSKVRLTWDEEDRSRKEAQKRAFSGAAELQENDLQAYLGSDSSDDDVAAADDTATAAAAADLNSGKSSKKEERRHKIREALGLSATASGEKRSKDDRKQKTPVDGGLQITFSAAFSAPEAEAKASEQLARKNGVFEETTKEMYIRKERERKARRKANAKGAHITETGAEDADNGDGDGEAAGAEAQERQQEREDPFDDPFFEDPVTANAQAKKASKKAKRAAAAAEEADPELAARKVRERAELGLLLADDDHGNEVTATANGTGVGFDMSEIGRAEKIAALAARKGRKSKKQKQLLLQHQQQQQAKSSGREENLAIDASNDPRFSAALFDNPDYAIDPTSSRFSGTKTMKALLEEGRKRQRQREDRPQHGDGVGARGARISSRDTDYNDDDNKGKTKGKKRKLM